MTNTKEMKPCDMPKEIWVGKCKHYGIQLTSKTESQECPVKYTRADQSPPLPDEVREAIDAGWYSIRKRSGVRQDAAVDESVIHTETLETLIRAATQQPEATPPTTDQRERALEAFRQDRKSGFALQYGEDIADTIEAALTAPPHVPQDTLSEVREALAFYANKKTTTQEIYMEGGKAAIKALATLDRFIEGDGWLPIESAPRDGMYVLLYSPLAADNGRPDCTYMVDKWQKNLSVDGFRTCNPFHWPYTHWRPLPTPPEDE